MKGNILYGFVSPEGWFSKSKDYPKIQTETDPKRQNDLISQQNTLLSYISGLGVGGSTDRVLLNN